MKWGLGGFNPWFLQRASAVYLLGYFLAVMAVFALCPPQGYEQWQGWLSHPLTWGATALFFLSLFMHAWVGVRDVILDYVHPVALRILVLAGVGSILILLTLWVFRGLFAVVTA